MHPSTEYMIICGALAFVALSLALCGAVRWDHRFTRALSTLSAAISALGTIPLFGQPSLLLAGVLAFVCVGFFVAGLTARGTVNEQRIVR